VRPWLANRGDVVFGVRLIRDGEGGAMAVEPIGRVHPARRGWRHEQVESVELPYGWELVDGEIAVRGQTDRWCTIVRDALVTAVGQARRGPYAVFVEQCVLIDERNCARPDLVVVDQTVVDTYAAECLPAESVALVVDIVAADGRADDWFRKPARYAAAGIACFWRVERGEDDRAIVYEYWLDHERGAYLPAPSGGDIGTFATAVPFRVRIDLSEIPGA
jgi:hypothetical protein